MPNLTSSSFTNGAPIPAAETTDSNGRPVKPLREAHSFVENDGQQISLSPLHYSPLQIAQPSEKKKRKVPRQSRPAKKSALTISIPKGKAAAKLLSSISEVNGAIQSLTLNPVPTSGSSSSNTKPERYALTPSPSPDIDSLGDPSGLRTPAKAITHNLSEPPGRLARGKRCSRSEGDDISPSERQSLGKRQMRAFF